jgi:subtilisin family serine protease
MKPISCKEISGNADAFIGIIVLYTFIFNACGSIIFAQQETAPGKYRIEFTDKNNSPFSIGRPEEFLSDRAIQRRIRQEIPIDMRDLPVNPSYIDSIKQTGVKLLNVSKWFNAVTVTCDDSSALEKISSFSFVKRTAFNSYGALPANNKHKKNVAAIDEDSYYDYGYSVRQINMHKGEKLHNTGYTGKNIHIAVIDAGFYNVDTLEAFVNIWQDGRILGTRDFVNQQSNIFQEHSHGKTVLSIIGGYVPGYLIGSAPDASFWLLRSEDVNSEYIIEEDNWIAAAEFADSAGVDIINTSLGYSVFDNTAQNHNYSDMDGNTTRISIAAKIAASKGILVVVSAGNEGNDQWKYITAPADADSVLAIGAVDSSGIIAPFSGRGPAFDGRIKPDVCAMGVKTIAQGTFGTISAASGTSVSAPIITGLSACLWQANPDAKVMDIQSAIKKSADRFNNPDTIYGYGIPNFHLANLLLKIGKKELYEPGSFSVFPNPFSSEIYILYNKTDESAINVSIYDLFGRIVYRGIYETVENKGFITVSKEISNLSKGIYIIAITSGGIKYNTRVVKL